MDIKYFFWQDGAIAHWVKDLLDRHEDLKHHPRAHVKWTMHQKRNHLIAPEKGGEFMDACRPASPVHTARKPTIMENEKQNQMEIPYLKQGRQ